MKTTEDKLNEALRNVLKRKFDDYEERPAPDALDRIRTALRGLRYGTVTAVVQDGVIIQVERTEKIRLERRSAGGPV